MTDTNNDTNTGLASGYEEPAAFPAAAPLAAPAALDSSDAPLVRRINHLDERVNSNIARMKRHMALALSAALATGSMLSNFKALHARDYGRFFEDDGRPDCFRFSQRAASNYCKLYLGVARLADERGLTDELRRQVSAYCADSAETVPLLGELLQANSLHAALRELGGLPAPPSPSLGERLDAVQQPELPLSWEEKRTRSWTRWGGCCEQLETYIEKSAAILTPTDREAAASRLEDLAKRLRAIPTTAAERLLA